MRKPKKTPTPTGGDDLHSAVLDFITRGRRAQEAVDRMTEKHPYEAVGIRPEGGPFTVEILGDQTEDKRSHWRSITRRCGTAPCISTACPSSTSPARHGPI